MTLPGEELAAAERIAERLCSMSFSAVLLAKKTGQPILPFTITPARAWELSKSWDRFEIPRPFTRARVEIAAPIFVPATANETELESHRLVLQAALDGLEERGQAWRTGLSLRA